MPYAFETKKIRLPRDSDRRVKISDFYRCRVRVNDECKSQREWASELGVSRRTIQFIQDPKKLEENKKRRDECGGWKQYYQKDIHVDTMREYRRYKKKVLAGKS